MNITNKDYAILSAAVVLLQEKYATDKAHEKILIQEASETLQRLDSKRQKDNARIASYINMKRKDNPNYAGGHWQRPPKKSEK